IADELLDAVAGRVGFDLMEAFAGPLPTIVIAELIGVDPADQRRFKRWSDDLVLALNPRLPEAGRQRGPAARLALGSYFLGTIARRRAEPRGDLISRLLAAQEADDRLTDVEILTTLMLLLAAGNVTTTDLIGNGVLALLEHPAELERLRRDPSLVPKAVEEMLRYDSPVVQVARIPLREVEFGGCPVAAGQTITL